MATFRDDEPVDDGLGAFRGLMVAMVFVAVAIGLVILGVWE